MLFLGNDGVVGWRKRGMMGGGVVGDGMESEAWGIASVSGRKFWLI